MNGEQLNDSEGGSIEISVLSVYLSTFQVSSWAFVIRSLIFSFLFVSMFPSFRRFSRCNLLTFHRVLNLWPEAGSIEPKSVVKRVLVEMYESVSFKENNGSFCAIVRGVEEPWTVSIRRPFTAGVQCLRRWLLPLFV